MDSLSNLRNYHSQPRHRVCPPPLVPKARKSSGVMRGGIVSHRRSCRDVSRDCYDEWSERFGEVCFDACVVNRWTSNKSGKRVRGGQSRTLQRNVEIFDDADRVLAACSRWVWFCRWQIAFGSSRFQLWNLRKLMRRKIVEINI